MLVCRRNGSKAEIHLLKTFRGKATYVFLCVTDASFFFSPCFCAASETLSLQLHNSGNLLQVIIFSTWLKAKIACNLLDLKPMCFSDRNVTVNTATYAQGAWHTALQHKAQSFYYFFFPHLYRKLYLRFPPKSTPPSFHQVHKQYFPFFPPFKTSIGLLPARINTQRVWICFFPCSPWLTLLLAAGAAPEGKALLTAPALFPSLSHSSSSHSPNKPLSKQDLHRYPFHQHPQNSNSPSGESRELCLIKKKTTHKHPCMTPLHRLNDI